MISGIYRKMSENYRDCKINLDGLLCDKVRSNFPISAIKEHIANKLDVDVDNLIYCDAMLKVSGKDRSGYFIACYFNDNVDEEMTMQAVEDKVCKDNGFIDAVIISMTFSDSEGNKYEWDCE